MQHLLASAKSLAHFLRRTLSIGSGPPTLLTDDEEMGLTTAALWLKDRGVSLSMSSGFILYLLNDDSGIPEALAMEFKLSPFLQFKCVSHQQRVVLYANVCRRHLNQAYM
eukprot:Em0024g433a